MLVFGVLVTWSAWDAMRGERGALFASSLIGIFHLLAGVMSPAYMHEPFWGVFVFLGGLALVLSARLGFVPSGQRPASPHHQPAA